MTAPKFSKKLGISPQRFREIADAATLIGVAATLLIVYGSYAGVRLMYTFIVNCMAVLWAAFVGAMVATFFGAFAMLTWYLIDHTILR